MAFILLISPCLATNQPALFVFTLSCRVYKNKKLVWGCESSEQWLFMAPSLYGSIRNIVWGGSPLLALGLCLSVCQNCSKSVFQRTNTFKSFSTSDMEWNLPICKVAPIALLLSAGSFPWMEFKQFFFHKEKNSFNLCLFKWLRCLRNI